MQNLDMEKGDWLYTKSGAPFGKIKSIRWYDAPKLPEYNSHWILKVIDIKQNMRELHIFPNEPMGGTWETSLGYIPRVNKQGELIGWAKADRPGIVKIEDVVVSQEYRKHFKGKPEVKFVVV